MIEPDPKTAFRTFSMTLSGSGISTAHLQVRVPEVREPAWHSRRSRERIFPANPCTRTAIKELMIGYSDEKDHEGRTCRLDTSPNAEHRSTDAAHSARGRLVKQFAQRTTH